MYHPRFIVSNQIEESVEDGIQCTGTNQARAINSILLFSSPEPKALGELIGWDLSRPGSVRPFTLSDMNIIETS